MGRFSPFPERKTRKSRIRAMSTMERVELPLRIVEPRSQGNDCPPTTKEERVLKRMLRTKQRYLGEGVTFHPPHHRGSCRMQLLCGAFSAKLQHNDCYL